MTAIDFTAEALRYASLGWKVFPLAAGSKVPTIKGGAGVKDATVCPAAIRAWGVSYPGANIGLACGEASGIVVIDVDPRNGGDGSVATLAAKGRVLPPGPRARTGNGGWHHLFRFAPSITNSKGRLGGGIDVKSTGGYIVAAPSWIVPSKDGKGGSYRWEISPFDVALPRLPIWLTALLAPPRVPLPRFEPNANSPASIEGLARFVANAPPGERNNRLHWAACRAGELAATRRLSERACAARLVAAAAACGLQGPEVTRTIESGMRSRGNS